MDVVKFRNQFVAFSDNQKYSDEMLELWNETASLYLKKSWALSDKQYQHALLLLTAHLAFLADKGANGDSAATGPVQSATEGSVSVSFATPQTKGAWQFWLATSPYGLQLWALLKVISIGGAYIGGLPERQAVRKVGGVFV